MNGVFILDKNGAFKSYNDWNQNDLGAVGIAVINKEIKILISLKYKALKWGGLNERVENVAEDCSYPANSVILNDFNGYNNTNNILRQIVDCDAAKWCKDYEWPVNINNISKGDGYLPGMGELKEIWKYKKDIDRCLSKLDISESELMATYYHWSSTQSNKLRSWAFDWETGSMNTISRKSEFFVRAFAKLL